MNYYERPQDGVDIVVRPTGFTGRSCDDIEPEIFERRPETSVGHSHPTQLRSSRETRPI